eukprot:g44564.t1
MDRADEGVDVDDHVTADISDDHVTSVSAHVTAPVRTPTPDGVSTPCSWLQLYTYPNAVLGIHHSPDLPLTEAEWPNPSPSTDNLIRLAELVPTLNNFSFDSSHFLQIKGVAKGTCMIPSYACIIIGFVKQSLFHNYPGTIPHLFLRYMDDCISAASCSCVELKQFINFANTFHPALKFTCIISDTSLPFLDLSVSISGNRLTTDIHFKPTDSHNYTSPHPPLCKNAFPYSHIVHICHICSQDEAFHSRISQISSYFRERRPNTDSGTGLRSICTLCAPTNLTFQLPSILIPLVICPSLASSAVR